MTDNELREQLAELNHIGDGRILATEDELVALIKQHTDRAVRAKLEQEIRLAVHKAFQKHANRGWVRGGDKLSELMSDVAKSISPIFESHLNRAEIDMANAYFKRLEKHGQEYANTFMLAISASGEANLQSKESK